MSAAVTPPAPARRRVPWDTYRKVSAWMGLLAALAVIVIIVTVGSDLAGPVGDGQAPSTTWTIVGLLAGPAVLAGVVSGSRFYELYAGYAQRLDATAQLSEADSARGNSVVGGFIGDGLWGSLIAGIAAAIPATIALSTVISPVAVIGLPVLALVAGIAWFTGWVAGAVASSVISTAIGIAVGAAGRSNPRERLPWILVAAFLPALLITVSLSAAVRFPGGRIDILSGLLYLLGAPFDAEFLLGTPLLVVLRILAWLSIALFVVLVMVGLPALINRSRGVPGPVVAADEQTPPVPRAPQA